MGGFARACQAGRCGRPSCGHTGSGPWDPSNSRALLNYTRSRHANFSRHGFELGNELEFNLSPAQTADAFRELRAMVDAFWPDAASRPRVVGPALNVRPDWLSLTLSALAPGDLDAVSYHVYPAYGRSLDLPTLMLEPGWLSFSHEVMAATQRATQGTQVGRAAELWIGETAAAWASGTEGVCDGFLSGFWCVCVCVCVCVRVRVRARACVERTCCVRARVCQINVFGECASVRACVRARVSFV